MPDDLNPEDPARPGDHAADDRDERVAGLLAVDPLDEVTRRRLVTAALSSTDAQSADTTRGSRRLVAAAAIVFVAVAGAGVVVALQGNGGNRAENMTAQAAPRGVAEQAADRQLDLSLASAPDVGDYGELTTAANVARLRTALASLGAHATSPDSATAAGKASEPADGAVPRRVEELDCSPSLPEGATVAVASGTYKGRDVVVVQREAVDGTRSLVAVDVGTCRTHLLS